MKKLLILAVLLPVPIFRLPIPMWTTEIEPIRTVATEEAKHHGSKLVTLIDLPRRGTTLKRLPGPTWWRCPECGGSTCLMYLGQHLTNPKSHHRISKGVVNGIDWRTLRIYHDNLHNAKVKPKPVVVRAAPEFCPECQIQRRSPITWRILGGRLGR